jgi:hypothetical protein
MSVSRQSELVGTLTAASSILGTMWPKPGVPSLANARDFIPGKVFESFRSAIKEASEFVTEEDGLELRDCILACNCAASKLFENHQQIADEAVDQFINLLFLTVGVAIHKLNGMSYPLPPWAENHSKVRPLKELLAVCRWQEELNIDVLLSNLHRTVENETQKLL